MTFETQQQADALCTVITLGFIKTAQRQTYIMYLDGKDDAAEHARHDQLKDQLERLGITLTFEQQSPGDKPLRPVILARTERSALQGDIVEDSLINLNELEARVNEYKETSLRGAYVGGGLFVEKAELLDPSILYRYEPEYRTVSPEVDKSYENAELVTKTVQAFLHDKFSFGQKMEHGGMILRRPEERPLDASAPAKPEGPSLFGSVHGMTQSIVHYSQANVTDKVSMELALSSDTCKVASCVPCSIFMWSNRTPATATHFGRGDNWNFPYYVFQKIRECSGPDHLEPLKGYRYAEEWMKAVWAAYDAGASHLMERLGSAPSPDLAHAFQLDHNYIPQMFLEALTFESSFLSRMLSTLHMV